jgi:hypothetical protein
LIDPIAIAEVPDEAADVAEKESLIDGKWISSLIVSKQREKKRQKSDPTKGSAPEWSWPRDGKG